MKKYFPLDSDYNTLYKQIGNAIKEYYPANISPFDAEYHEYAGIKKLQELAWGAVGIRKNYRSWVAFIKRIGTKLNKEVVGTTYGFTPGYSADLILEKYQDDALTRVKKLSFAVSHLGPFYSICGIDETFIKEREEGFALGYHAINVVTASPFKEFEACFVAIEQLIKKKFNGYHIVPFEVCMTFLKDIETLDSMGQEGTVYNALFNHSFNFYTHFRSRGDGYYGLERNPNIKVTLSPPPKFDKPA